MEYRQIRSRSISHRSSSASSSVSPSKSRCVALLVFRINFEIKRSIGSKFVLYRCLLPLIKSRYRMKFIFFRIYSTPIREYSKGCFQHFVGKFTCCSNVRCSIFSCIIITCKTYARCSLNFT